MRLCLLSSTLFLWLMSCDSKPVSQSVPQASKGPAAAIPTNAPATATGPADSLSTFRWEDVCTNIGTYDPGKYTRQQLIDTYQVASGFGLSPMPLVTRLTEFTNETYRQADKHLEHEYDSLTRVLRRVEVVPTPYWKRLRHLRELELAEQYEFDKLEITAYFQPAALWQSRYYATCDTYANALAATDTATVLQAWRQLIVKQKVNNSFPEQFDQEYAAFATSPDGIRYAKMQLLGFGFCNCARQHGRYNRNEVNDRYQPLEKFIKLFRRVRQSNCEDTD
jgi:hypothetical protein